MLPVCESQGSIDQLAGVEGAGGGIAQEGAGIGVLILATQLLEDQDGLAGGGAVLLLYADCIGLGDYFKNSFQILVD